MAFLLLLSLTWSAVALTEGEILALDALLESFPDLSVTTPPWTSNTADACKEPVFYGLTCTSDGHIQAVYEKTAHQDIVLFR